MSDRQQDGGAGDGEPEGRVPPAPGILRLVQEFVNTNDIEDGVDELAGPDLLRSWLVERALIDSEDPVGPEDLDRALRMRESIRALAMANNGWTMDGAALETLNDVASEGSLRVRFTNAGRSSLEPTATGVDRGLSAIVAVVHQSMAEGNWSRLKACRKDSCRWVFFDSSRNRSKTWCAMSICGNRVKTKAYYQRMKQLAG